MVFIKKASISGEVWFSSEAGKEAGRKKGCLLGFETTLLFTPQPNVRYLINWLSGSEKRCHSITRGIAC